MTRLVNDTRDTILENLLRHKFDPVRPIIAAKQSKIANKLYNMKYSAKVRKQMDELPEGWLPTDNDIAISYEGTVMRFRFNGVSFTYGYDNKRYIYDRDAIDIVRRFPSDEKGQVVFVISNDDHISDDIRDFIKTENEYIDQIAQIQSEIRGLLSTFHTVEKLIEAWPEVKDFIPETTKPAITLPAIPINDINQRLGLIHV